MILAGIHEEQIDYLGMPVSADDFVRGIDLILEAQQQFLNAMAPPPKSAKSKTLELQENDTGTTDRSLGAYA